MFRLSAHNIYLNAKAKLFHPDSSVTLCPHRAKMNASSEFGTVISVRAVTEAVVRYLELSSYHNGDL